MSKVNKKLECLKSRIGEVVDDMLITNAYMETNKRGAKDYKISMKCNICNRERSIHEKYVDKGSATLHKNCMKLVPRDDHFHSKYKGMVKRMTNPKYENLHRYGGRGLEFGYENYIDFYDDFYEEYLEHSKIHGEKNTTIERVNTDIGYIKSNITFATPKEQANNRSTNWINVFVKYKDSNWTSIENVQDFCKENNLHDVSVYKCLAGVQIQTKGWHFKGDRIIK